MKIASLLPSNTEIAFALGLGAQIIGVSHECDFPAEARTKPILTKSKINQHTRSGEIDKDVMSLVKKGLSVYDIDAEKLKALRPDIILTQDQCDVCAVSLRDVEEATRVCIPEVQIVSLKPANLKDILHDILIIGKATNKCEEAQALVKSLTKRIEEVKKKTQNLERPTLCCIEWLQPLMTAGNWIPEMIEIAGGKNIFGRAGKHSLKIAMNEILRLQPDKIVIAPCGFPISRTLQDIGFLTATPEWGELKAVRQNEVYVVDGNAYFNRPSQRIVDTLEILAAIIHPELFTERRELALRLRSMYSYE